MGDSGLESRGSRFVMGGYRQAPSDADGSRNTPPTPRKNESPGTPRKGDEAENKSGSTPSKDELSLKGKLPTASSAAAVVSSPRAPSPSASSQSPWSPRIAGSPRDVARYRESADVLLLRLANAFFDLIKKTQQTLPTLELTNALTGEEILNKLLEWLECDKDTAFLYASVLLQQGFLFHASMGVFIETPIVSYNIKDPVLTHYARCMRRGLGKECLHLKKGGTIKKNNKCEGCFSGTEAVDWMLLNFPHMVKKLRVESVGNAVAVGVALLEEGIIEHVKQKDNKKIRPFRHDDKEFYRFKSRLFKSRPVGGKTVLLNPLPAQLEFIACESLLDGLKTISEYVSSSDGSTESRKRVGFDVSE